MIGLIVETYLNYYRNSDREALLKKHSSRFEREEPHIISLLKQTELYHGTGTHHYTYAGGSKYDSSKAEITHTLPKILADGLVPQKDLFNTVFQTGVSHSLSLTKNRLYARGYASLFHGQVGTLQYDYGPRLLWVLPIIWRLLTGAWRKRTYDLFHVSRKERLAMRRHVQTMVKGWTGSFRGDKKYTSSAWQWPFVQTDIPDNFGIVIGIKHNVVTPLVINYPNVAKDEVRTDITLTPDVFSHVQAPLRHVEEVQTILKEVKLDIPVIPIEYVALHEHKLGVQKLVKLSKRSVELQAA